MKLVFSPHICATQTLCVYQINIGFHFLNDTVPRIFVCSFIYCDMFRQSFRPQYGPGVDIVSNRNGDQEYFPGGKRGRCKGLTTLPPSCADCLEIWEPQPPETLRGCPGLYRYSFTFTAAYIRQYHNTHSVAPFGKRKPILIARHMVRMVPCVARHHPHRTHDLRSGSQDHHPSKNSMQKTICYNSTSNAPDDGRMYPKHVELRITLLHQVGIPHYFMKKMHGQTTIKFYENSVQREPSCYMWTERQTDRHYEVKSRFLQFCKCP